MRAANELPPRPDGPLSPPLGVPAPPPTGDCVFVHGLRFALPNPEAGGGDSDSDEALAKPRNAVGGSASSSSELMSAIFRFAPVYGAVDEESMADAVL